MFKFFDSGRNLVVLFSITAVIALIGGIYIGYTW